MFSSARDNAMVPQVRSMSCQSSVISAVRNNICASDKHLLGSISGDFNMQTASITVTSVRRTIY